MKIKPCKEIKDEFLLSKNTVRRKRCGLIVRLLQGIVYILAVSFATPCFADTASYYTYQSCVREGTSGIYTASGERFNENDLTCAMRSREWGAMYKVTNLENNKSVIVRLNDFGPNKKLWNKGRKIDLSKAAFQAIAPLSKGVINVRIERCAN